MTSRTISIGLTAVVVLGGLGAGGYAYWAHQHESHRQAQAMNAQSPPPSSGHRQTVPAQALIGLLPAIPRLDLQWSPMDELAPLARSRRRSNVKITRVSVPPPLNLELPGETTRDADALNTNTFAQDSAISARTDESAIVDPLVFNLNPNIDDRDTDLADDTHLFNKNNGLRGFMAQNWLSRNVGLQGGLAIKENRLREEDSDLRDNVAIGMGVLFAF